MKSNKAMMSANIDKNKTLDQLENNYWGTAPEDATGLVIKCHNLRSKKLKDFTIEDFRLMIGQSIGLKYLVPLVLEILRENPFAEGDFYEGDLLDTLLKSRKDFWQENPNLKKEVEFLFEKNKEKWEQFNTTEEIKEGLKEAYLRFKVG